MSIPGAANPLLLAQLDTGYKITRSLRFNSSDSAYLSRTPASAGNRKTWTLSWWMKRSKIGGVNEFIWGTGGSNTVAQLFFDSSERLNYGDYTSAPLTTAAVFRDASAWYHCVFSYDTTNATAADRIILYVNGTRALTSSYTAPTQNSDGAWNRAVGHVFGGTADGGSNSPQPSFSGYLADIHFIDGQVLTPSSFAETNATTGQWVPKAYSGTYGTNGFQLKFADNSAATAAALGKDTSGNGNNWTPNNLSVTAGAGNDSLVDTPTSYGTDTGAGGEVRGNYATLNPLQTKEVAVLSNGNLDYAAGSSVDTIAAATITPTSGKWYWETTITSAYNNTYWGGTGVSLVNAPLAKVTESSTAGVWASTDSSLGGLWINGSRQSTHTTWSNNDVIGCAFDAGAMTLEVYRNNVKLGSTISVPAGYYRPFVFVARDTASSVTNFGQRPFAYTAPSGFKALCDTNLPAPVVAKPSTVMDVKLYTGTGATQTLSGLGFSPDLVWAKNRTDAASHQLYDIVRGAGNVLYSNSTSSEEAPAGTLTAFTSDGFTLNSTAAINASTKSFVAWAWDAGSSTVTNTQGSITSQVRANASAGFSVVVYTGAGGTQTVGHGLGVKPSLIIVKRRDVTSNWLVYHASVGATKYLYLNATDASASWSGFWGNTEPTSSVFTLGGDGAVNNSGSSHVAYCFAPVAGYSSFGSYAGNGDTSGNGPFVFTGHLSRWLMIKRVDTAWDWILFDTARDTYNQSGKGLRPNLSNAEYDDSGGIGTGYTSLDFLSNGFKVRGASVRINDSGGTYVYASFAQNPFQYARAR